MASSSSSISSLYKPLYPQLLKKFGSLSNEALTDALRPKFFDGRWHKPQLSALNKARLRNALLDKAAHLYYDNPSSVTMEQASSHIPAVLNRSLRKFIPIRFKGTKAVRTREDRIKKIENAMKEMPAKEIEYKNMLKSRRDPHDILNYYFAPELAAQLRAHVITKHTTKLKAEGKTMDKNVEKEIAKVQGVGKDKKDNKKEKKEKK